MPARSKLLPYRLSLAGTLLAAREAVMAPIRPMLRQVNISEQQWRVLRVLREQPSMDAATIASAAMLHPPSVSRILRELSDRKLIDRSADTQDGRRSIVSISTVGEALVESTSEHTLEVLEEIGETFGHERLAAMMAELAAFTKKIRKE